MTDDEKKFRKYMAALKDEIDVLQAEVTATQATLSRVYTVWMKLELFLSDDDDQTVN